MNEDQVLVLIHKYLTEEINPREKQKIEDWLGESPENAEFFASISKSWELSLDYGDQYHPDASTGLQKLHSRIRANEKISASKIIPVKWFIRVAAVFVLIAGFYFIYNQVGIVSEPESFATSSEEVMLINLPDGSIAYLNKDSEILPNPDFGKTNRDITFSGEGQFRIAHNPELPFRIQCPDSRVEVLGTEFFLNSADPSRGSEIIVQSGKVRFSNATGNELILLPENAANSDPASGKILEIDPESVSKGDWSAKVLKLHKAPLPEVFELLAFHYDVQFEWMDTAGQGCQYNSTVPLGDLNQNLDAIALAFKMQILPEGENLFKLSGGDYCK